VVVTAGVTSCVPPGTATEPIPLSMTIDAAFCDDHVKVEVPCPMMVAGSAVSVSVGATCVTVMVTVAVAVPPGPVAVKT